MVLSQAEPGKEVTLVDIIGGRGVKSKLYSMGLIPGTKVKILTHASMGPVMVRVRDCRLALGRGMAEKIIVE
ncbi:MAG: ferrous iron transport protein A [Deltaproteobacteria bacterium]|nr:ferrous iron transport protein A [Deltaproteobacteria bacterium]MBW2298963.1 ferrous iron transport protein A [Deltaproteobacteria bacterium]RLB14814.1 MAG: hypothetical protein DRG63_07920 [Deltaproteobacteria bacterium]